MSDDKKHFIKFVSETAARPIIMFKPDGTIEVADDVTPSEAAKKFVAYVREIWGIPWQPISTAPRDGTLFDIRRFGRRYVDCYMTAGGNIVREHDYPMVTQRFIHCTDNNTQWMPRPPDLVMPYATYGPNDEGRYIP